MKLLLDTHSLIWWFNDDPRLGPRVRTLIADSRSVVLVSSVSFWEISIKHRIGKLDEIGSDMMKEVEADGFAILGISAAHLDLLEHMPRDPELKDPFDNLIMAQAIVEQASLITGDRRLLASQARTIRAR